MALAQLKMTKNYTPVICEEFLTDLLLLLHQAGFINISVQQAFHCFAAYYERHGSFSIPLAANNDLAFWAVGNYQGEGGGKASNFKLLILSQLIPGWIDESSLSSKPSSWAKFGWHAHHSSIRRRLSKYASG